MLRNTIFVQIKELLDNSENFSSTDFDILSNNGGLNIIYRYNDSFFFEVKIPHSLTKLTKSETETMQMHFTTKHRDIDYYVYEFSGRIRPGTVANEETIRFEGKSKLLSGIKAWTENLWEEIMVQPQLRQIKNIEEQLNTIQEKFDSISEEYFTKDEATTLKERLDELEQQFTEKLESEVKDKEVLVELLNELHVEIEKLKKQSNILNKKHWFTSFGVKIFKWVSKEENRKFLKDSRDFIRPLIPESIGNII